MTTMSLFERIKRAHSAVRPQVSVTPLERSRPLSNALGCEVLLKSEHLQPTGTFKIRGATNKIHVLGENGRRTGVITASTGNHGQAVARAGALARLGGRKLLFSNAPRHYVEQVLRAIGVGRFFDAVYSIEDARYLGKPALHGFHVLLRNHDLDPHRCAFVDDALDNLRTAHRLGMSTVWVSRDRRRAPFVDWRVRSVIELPRLVFR